MYEYADERLVNALTLASLLTMHRDPVVRRAAREIVKLLRGLADEMERSALEELYVETLAQPR